jgi:hypothetical protein
MSFLTGSQKDSPANVKVSRQETMLPRTFAQRHF